MHMCSWALLDYVARLRTCVMCSRLYCSTLHVRLDLARNDVLGTAVVAPVDAVAASLAVALVQLP